MYLSSYGELKLSKEMMNNKPAYSGRQVINDEFANDLFSIN
jgi:hypothetical protein